MYPPKVAISTTNLNSVQKIRVMFSNLKEEDDLDMDVTLCQGAYSYNIIILYPLGPDSYNIIVAFTYLYVCPRICPSTCLLYSENLLGTYCLQHAKYSYVWANHDTIKQRASPILVGHLLHLLGHTRCTESGLYMEATNKVN
jgi:hypothetical protein